MQNNTVFEKTNDEAEGETKLTPTKRNNLSVQVEDEASDRPDEEAIGDTNADDEEVKAFKESTLFYENIYFMLFRDR